MRKRKRSALLLSQFSFLFILFAATAMAQNNSPYSRYGLGDVVPNTNIVNRGKGSITAGERDFLHINFNNPASYSEFQAVKETKSKKIVSGRVLLDAGLNLESRTLQQPKAANKFTATDLYFSYLQIGVPLRKGWGLAFGLRPLSRIGYKINEGSRVPNIDSTFTEYEGSGGSYLPTIGTGVAIKNLSIGVNVGYLFGRREISTSRAFVNDTVLYYNSLHKSATSFGSLYANAGLQYKIELNKHHYLNIGASGNLKQTIKASQDITVGTFTEDPNSTSRLTDTVYKINNVKGKIIYPASFIIGFTTGGTNDKYGSWQLGADVVHTSWDDYRFYGMKEAVQSNTQIRVGGEFRPELTRAYTSAITYRAGFYAGNDYVTAGGKLFAWGASFGLGLPVSNQTRLSQQFTIVNLALEYNSRGTNKNPLKENMFRLSVGLNFSDLWFSKRKYD